MNAEIVRADFHGPKKVAGSNRAQSATKSIKLVFDSAILQLLCVRPANRVGTQEPAAVGFDGARRSY